MVAQREVGMDHEHYEWLPLPGRPALSWPGGAGLALGVMVELMSVDSSVQPGIRAAALPGGLGPRPHPNVPLLAHREYGHRVGIFRVLDALHDAKVPASVVLDAETAVRYPWLVDHVLTRGACIVAGGISPVNLMTEETPADVESEYVERTLDLLEERTGARPVGWYSSEYSESSRTPEILAAAGVRYVCDWPNDDQPYWMNVPQGDLISLPPTYELDDANALLQRRVPPAAYGRLLQDSFDVLHRESTSSARHYLLHLRPWLSGQPFRIRYLEEALAHATAASGVWAGSTDEMVAHYRNQIPRV